MHNSLSRDALIVFAFWFCVLYVISGFPVSGAPLIAVGVGLIWVVGLAAGLASIWFATEGRIVLTRVQLGRSGGPAAKDCVSITLMNNGVKHAMPLPVGETPDRGKVSGNLIHQLEWWPAYAKKYPRYARVLDDVYAVMESKPGVPASPGGGHGGLSLVLHSMNVLHAILKVAPDWAFPGIKNKSGKITVPLQDQAATELRLPDPTVMGTPLLPLLGFAHDIGKVPCYIMENGKVVEEVPGHGERGAALLRTLPSVNELPIAERDALLLAVEFYHHLSDMPTARWISDRIRSLTALLYLADCEASDLEGDKRKDVAEARSLYQKAAQPAAPAAPTGTPAPTSLPATTPTPAPPVSPPPSRGVAAPRTKELPADVALAISAVVDTPDVPAQSAFAFDNGATPFDIFMEALESPDAINSKNRKARIAWKHADWLYVQEANIRERAADLTGDKTLTVTKSPSHLAFSETLLNELAAKGMLLTDCGGMAVAPKDAIWLVQSSRAGSNPENAKAYQAIVVRADMTPRIASIEDCNFPPVIIGRGTHPFRGGKTITPPSAPVPPSDEPSVVWSEPPSPAGTETESGPLDFDLNALEMPEFDAGGDDLPAFAIEALDSLVDAEEAEGDPSELMGAEDIGLTDNGGVAGPRNEGPWDLPEGNALQYKDKQHTGATKGRRPSARPENTLERQMCAPSQKHDTFTSNGTPLTYDSLFNLANCGLSEFGFELKDTSRGRFGLFDPDLLAKSYSFDLDNLPEGIAFLQDKNRLVVAL